MGNPRATHSIRMESPSSTARFGGGLIIFGETTIVKETDIHYMQSCSLFLVFGKNIYLAIEKLQHRKSMCVIAEQNH